MDDAAPLPVISELFDVSVPISARMHTMPDNRSTELLLDHRLDRGDVANLSALTLSLHAGSHVDAPRHMLEGGAGIDRLPLRRVVGPAWVAATAGMGDVSAADLEGAGVPPGTTRLLLKTTNSALWAKASVQAEEYRGLENDGAKWVVDRGIDLVGIDYLGIEPAGRAVPATHHILMRAGVTIVEGLDLRAVEPGPYLLLCLPLPIVDGDGSPARVVLAR